MDTRAVVDIDRQLQVSREVYNDIMRTNIDSNQWNRLNAGNMKQVLVDQRIGDVVYNLVCLDDEGDITLVNRHYPEGKKLRLPVSIGRIIYIIMFTSQNQRILSFINQSYNIRHILVDDIIDHINSGEDLNLPQLQDVFQVVSVMINGDTIQWIDDHQYLNYARVEGDRLIVDNVRDRIVPVRLRHGYMIDDHNNVYKIDRNLKLELLFRYDIPIVDVCKGYPNTITSVMNDEGRIDNYEGREYIDTINAPDVNRFISSMNNSDNMYIELIDGRIITKNYGQFIRLPSEDGVFILDELPYKEDRVKSNMLNVPY